MTTSQASSPRSTALERALDKALNIPARSITHTITTWREQFPEATTEELIARAEDRFLRESALSSAAVGASAGWPGIGTGAATALTIGQCGVFLSAATVYILTAAELRGLPLEDPDKRRALVLAALMGREGSEAIQGSLGLSALYWATQSLAEMPASTVMSVNSLLEKQIAKRFLKKHAVRGGALIFGRLLPLGIGAFIGYTGGRSLAQQVIDGAEAALGPASIFAAPTQPTGKADPATELPAGVVNESHTQEVTA